MLVLTLALAVNANAATLEPVQEIPNPYDAMNWNDYTLEQIKFVNKSREALVNICLFLKSELSAQAYETCEIARDSTSATERVKLYLQAAQMDNNEDLAKFAVHYARQRMTEKMVVKLVSEVEQIN